MIQKEEALSLTSDDIAHIQLQGLKKTLIACYENVSFYKTLFSEAGFDPYSFTSLDQIHDLPFTTKQDLRDNYPDKLFAVPKRDIREIHMSSGTTGVATVGAYSEKDLRIWSDCFSRGISFAGGTEDDICHVCYGYGLFTGGLGAHYGGIVSGCMTIPMSAGNTERQIRVMRDMGSTILCCTPSYAMHIADAAIAMGLDPANDFSLRAGIHGAEAFSDNFRKDLEKKFNYKVLDIYGLTETMGPGVAIECRYQNGLHLAEDHFYAEIVDPDTGSILPDGEWGELVITTVDREATPVIRYRTRDITRIIPDKCACGCHHRRIDRLQGRTDDMIILRGVNVFPSQIEDVMKTMKELSSWYVVELTDRNHLIHATLKVELEQGFEFDEIAAITRIQAELEHRLRTALSVGIDVVIVEPQSIPRSTGKAKRILDLR